MIITHDLGVLSSISDRICVLYGGRVAEYGGTPAVLGTPRHPYTEGLMQSLPGASAIGAAMVPIQGAPPSLDAMPGGCAFHPRCEWAQESCRTTVPTLRIVEDGRKLACDVDPLRRRVGQAPVGQAPVGQAPVGQAPVGQAPVGQAPVGRS